MAYNCSIWSKAQWKTPTADPEDAGPQSGPQNMDSCDAF